jgi:2,5-diketo-D-gluconate reductase B
MQKMCFEKAHRRAFGAFLLKRPDLKAALETGVPFGSFCSVVRGEVPNTRCSARSEQDKATPARSFYTGFSRKAFPINTMSTKPPSITANFEIMDFILSSIGVARVDALMATGHRIVDRSLVPWAPNFDRGRLRTSSH